MDETNTCLKMYTHERPKIDCSFLLSLPQLQVRVGCYVMGVVVQMISIHYVLSIQLLQFCICSISLQALIKTP